jgi:hypothetical protein
LQPPIAPLEAARVSDDNLLGYRVEQDMRDFSLTKMSYHVSLVVD